MYKVALPISKSIANRILLLQAIHGDPLMRVSSDMPDDVLVLHDTLEQLQTFKQGAAQTPNKGAAPNSKQAPLVLNLKNCGTALRFLQVHLEYCYKGEPIVLDGDPRLMERNGAPTTQTTSARILHGEAIPVSENESPYITLSRRIRESYLSPLRGEPERGLLLEPDWSSAAFWYEYVAIHGGELLLENLKKDSLQGDRIVADLYAKHFGVKTTFTPEGAQISNVKSQVSNRKSVKLDFTDFPDLYPAIALTCERLGITLHATGTDRLRFKESDRLEAVRFHEVRNDHRMAMALLAADFLVPKGHGYFLIRNQDSASVPDFYDGNDLQKIIAKSYPRFVEFLGQITTVERRSNDGQTTVKANVTTPTITHITPRKGINDDHLGKKHALSKLIHAATSEYVWLHDDDVIWPNAAPNSQFSTLNSQFANADLIILPLRMESILDSQFSILNSLQIAEYAAIQELTMRTAKRGHAVMCSGANLIVRREAWLACEPDLHPEIPSGDDMFLLEAMKKRGMQIAVIDEPDYTAVVRPASTWRAFFRQRMRWAGKAPKYTDPDILRCGALVVTANLLQLLCPLILLVKFPIEYSLIKKREPRTKWYVALLLEILYPFYMFASLLGGFFRQRKW
ncbi:MAG: glycosyltransferase [Paludibacteraceae bacterium]|nr:glycosyltransferase [Paludibacteraceae bacterium]